MDETFEVLTTPDEYTVTIAHPKGGHVTVRSASDITAPEVGRLVTGDVLRCTLDFYPGGDIWATIIDFDRVPAYQHEHFALVYAGKTFGTYKKVEQPTESEYIIHVKDGVERKFVLE